ncbi:hypothetical protein QFZ82_007822 [Streptomyces sp. V4I23]|nr:hypothetical protein [Streptomyces sp. V4I23]
MHRETASPEAKQLGESLLDINAAMSSSAPVPRWWHGPSTRSPGDLSDIVSHVVAQTALGAERTETVYKDAGEGPYCRPTTSRDCSNRSAARRRPLLAAKGAGLGYP